MKITLTYKEANLLRAIIWELADERGIVYSAGDVWRLSDLGGDLASSVAAKLEDANDAANRESGKDRDLSGSPKGTIQDARWSK